MNDQLFLNWELSNFDKESLTFKNWVPASVPGALQLDIAKAENYQPYYYANNCKDYLWMEDVGFTYRALFDKPILAADQRLFFISKGIDYKFDIFFNEEPIFHQEGMFTWVNIDLTDLLMDENELRIYIHPVPKSHHKANDRFQASKCVKPAVSYGWDWHPRLIPSGIWDDTFLEIRSQSHISNLQITYLLDHELKSADCKAEIVGHLLSGLRYEWSILDEQHVLCSQTSGILRENNFKAELKLDNISLWWTHDQGKPTLYTSIFILLLDKNSILQTIEKKIGFRQIRLVMNEGAWEEPKSFPKTRSTPPITVEINGRRIFCKGSNWVGPEIFPGLITRQRYNELINRAIDANFNLLRVWGGGIVNKESFYEICDEMGIMIWQEFPLACMNYKNDPHYLITLQAESKSIINRLKQHPCLAIWCGGNELFNNWSGMTDQSLALRLLNSQCLKYDPQTPFLMTSPLMGMAHGNYVFRDFETGEEVFIQMDKAHNTAYTEFGVPSPSSMEVLNKIIPENELWPPKPSSSWETHHAYNAWVGDTWLMQGLIEDYFGKSSDLEALIKNGQTLQCEGLRFIFEEARRQKPYCSMALSWCFNESWPSAANTSLINWPNLPKPAFYAVKNACRPVLASAKYKKFKWSEGEEFTADIWILNDSPLNIPGGKLVVKILINKEIILHEWDFTELQANTNFHGPTVKLILPAWETERFWLKLEVIDRSELNSEYLFLYKPLIYKYFE